MSYQEKDFRKSLSLDQEKNALITLIAINLTVFTIFGCLSIIYFLTNIPDAQFKSGVLNWFTLPASFDKFLSRPWTIITHFFLHDPNYVWSVFGNTLWLWAFGYILHDLTGNKKLVPLYIYGGLMGGIFYLTAFNLFPALKPELATATAVGASAGVMSVAIATTMISPDYRIFPMLNGGIPLWVLTILFIIVDFATIPYNSSNKSGHIVHIGGAFAGFLYIIILRRGYDTGEWMNNFFDWVNNLFNPDKPKKKGTDIRDEYFYKRTKQPYTKSANVTQQRVDEILDKINQKGYHYLSEEEKELLKRASEKDL